LARSASISIENTASKGLITEATGLNFPENAWTDALNVVPDNKGTTTRRLGINYEIDATTISVVRNDSIIKEFRWTNVGGNGDLNFVVVQVGDTLYFFEETTTSALSVGFKNFTVDLSALSIAGSPSTGMEFCDFSSGKGYLFVTHPYTNPFFITYTPLGDTITTTTIDLRIRDFEGVVDDDEIEADNQFRPSALSVAHEYNLRNQGWDTNVFNVASAYVDSIPYYLAQNPGTYPSNSEQWWNMLNNANGFFDPSQYNGDIPGNRLAPRGHFVLNPFLTDRAGQTGVTGSPVETDSSYFRPSVTAFFAGRVWYSGVNYQGFGSTVYFSQIVEYDKQIGRCYQDQDPTSQNFSDLLATDGGTIKILEAGQILKLFATHKSILVFATNGIWSISGSDVAPFKATEYTVTKISGLRTESSSSFVDIQGFPCWWNEEGIFLILSDDVTNFKVQSLTDTTIKTLYNEIPKENKPFVKGAYDPVEKIVQWVYNTGTGLTSDNRYNYNRILSLNTLTGAFYPWSYDVSSGVYINGIINTTSISRNSIGSLELVVDNLEATVVDSLGDPVTIFSISVLVTVTDSLGNPVIDNLGNEVTSVESSGTSSSSVLKYLISKRHGSSTNYDFSFGESYNDLNTDWDTVGSGVGYSSFFTSGYKLHSDAQRFGQNNYVVIYANNVTNASAFLNTIWDYGKVTGAVNQIYRLNLTLPITQTKIMLRGRGRAFQFNVSSDGNDPFEIIGWSVFETQNSSI
jgi:hypothetical protein